MAKYKTIITTAGAAKIAAVLAGAGSIVLDNTAKMAVGDGGGTLPTPSPAQTKLVNEVHRASINKASIDASDPKNIIAELVIPPEIGGFWLREMALYDAAGTLLAVGNMAETYKPSLSEGAGRKMVIRMVIAVSEVSAITITIDTSTVMATQDYVDTEIDKHAKSRNHPDATLTAKGFTQLSSATDSTSEALAATPKAVKAVMDATSLKAPLESPALTGNPTAPTASQGTSTLQLANTRFVREAITALINSAPGDLDTLGELAAALGNDANFAATMMAALATKAPLNSPALSGIPTAPTAAPGTNTLQLANTRFVQAAVSALVNASPAALDTLKELADALGNDANFATTMTNALAGKQQKDNTLTNISGKDVKGLLRYLGLDSGAPPIGFPMFWLSADMPNTIVPAWSDMVFLKLNGATFSAATYPLLAIMVPGLTLPEVRGEFPRIWDDGRGVDAGRELLSAQLDALQNITGAFSVADNNSTVGGIGAPSGVFSGVNDTGRVPVWTGGSVAGQRYAATRFNAADVVRTATETRSRNIAFNFLVRAK